MSGPWGWPDPPAAGAPVAVVEDTTSVDVNDEPGQLVSTVGNEAAGNSPVTNADLVTYLWESSGGGGGAGVFSTIEVTVGVIGEGLAFSPTAGEPTLRTNQPADDVILRNNLLTDDAQAAFGIQGNGSFQWGAGGDAATDLTLGRLSAAVAELIGSLVITEGLMVGGGAVVSPVQISGEMIISNASSLPSTGTLAAPLIGEGSLYDVDDGQSGEAVTSLTLPPVLVLPGVIFTPNPVGFSVLPTSPDDTVDVTVLILVTDSTGSNVAQFNDTANNEGTESELNITPGTTPPTISGADLTWADGNLSSAAGGIYTIFVQAFAQWD